MKVVLVEPGKMARMTEIDSSLQSMQKLVGGLIQAVYPWQDAAALVCSDEGKLLGLPLNRALQQDGQIYDAVVGTFFVCGIREEDFCSLTPQQTEKYLREFREPEMFMQTPDGIAVAKCSEEQYRDFMKSKERREMER